MRFTRNTLPLLALFLICGYLYRREQIVRKFSFDVRSKHMPDSYHTFGASAKLRHKIKLIPPVDLRYGGVFLSEEFLSSSFAIDFTFKINSLTENSDGFVFWYTPEIPTFDSRSGRIHGVETNTRGFSIWVHRDQRRRRGTGWRVFAHYDDGKGFPLEKGKILPDNSCTFMLDPTKAPVKMRFEKVASQLKILITDDNAESDNLRSCMNTYISGIPNQGFFGFTSGNANGVLNDIDILKIVVADLEKSSLYLKTQENEPDDVYFSLSDEQEKVYEDDPLSAQDIFHMQRKDGEYSDVGNGINFETTDSQEEVLYKVYEQLYQFNINMKEMIEEARNQLTNPNSRLEETTIPNLMKDLKYTREALDYMAQGINTLDKSMNYIASGKYAEEEAQAQQQARIAPLQEADAVDRLNIKLTELERKFESQKGALEARIVDIKKQTQIHNKEMSNRVKRKADEIGKIATNEESNAFLPILFVSILLLVLFIYVNRKTQQSRKKHIL
ncbi:unnamed protein product [Moneuplotes crassus]|uniref:L-type lectin-like domain-containing protein n=1 Tax=Euplotes crassus TaxID=5936 RepID=A0AAD1XA57_EUPCR|nr:unnamed protein product [Moneuplotes crassus]